MKCIIHDYRKINENEEPKYTLSYYEGIYNKVGVYACRCIRCGKKKDKKFIMPINQCM